VAVALLFGCSQEQGEGEPAVPSVPAAPATPDGAIEVVVVPAAPPPDAAGFEDQRQDIWAALRARVAQLTAAGTYKCCIKVPCSHCALMTGGCNCGPGLRDGEPVCHECALMWMRGQGAVEGIDPAAVLSFLEAEKARRGLSPRCGP